MASLLNDKANAMRRIQRKLNLENIFHLFNVGAAILFFSHSFSFPITLQTLSHLHHTFISLFHNSFYAFLFLNAIILFLFALSNNKNKENNNNDNNVGVCTDDYDEILNHSESRLVVTAQQEQPRTAEKEFVETVTAVTETTAASSCTTVATVTEAVSVSEKKPYRRVQSESYERRMVVAAARGELKRWETVRLRRPFESELRCVEELSEEEFNRAVEEFIALHKRMQWEEQLTQNLACSPSN
ncbi:uncharacterized protein LOC114163731 [Vigna unguiculata]|uniref:Transmembrane protein n=1 Tax=Vigna unguiculata TaxID=3917 RepID=A0A4D6NVN4_VIGUN|nr:uncharacterized protein LOC114163731 [Vigna unguiculata]QCE16629.1 hypothetical protein DEO72_LG11g3646 [Vigna unguiculata]